MSVVTPQLIEDYYAKNEKVKPATGIWLCLEQISKLNMKIDELQLTIDHLRSCPLPAEPHERDPAHRQWHLDVQHYETHLASNPPPLEDDK